jgi:hypothetical protein
VINLDNKNLDYSTVQLPVNRHPHIHSTLLFGENSQGKLLGTKLYGGSGTTNSAQTGYFYQRVVVTLPQPLRTLEPFSSFPSLFATNISCPLQISFKSPLPTQFSRPFCVVCSISLSALQLCFKIKTLISSVRPVTY